MRRTSVVALVVIAAAFVPSLSNAQPPTFVGCPAGQAIQGINFVTRSLVCVPVGDSASLVARVAALETALAAANATIACMSKVGTDVFFDGCNVHIRSGAGATDAPVNGLGNLIIGYNETNGVSVPPVRTGSHNLVVGPDHTYSSSGGFVAGVANVVSAPHTSVSGGSANIASADGASVGGGVRNTASGLASSVTGGNSNTASGNLASVSGGVKNVASGANSSVSGGLRNTAIGQLSSVSGGQNRSATGDESWAAGSLYEPN